MISLLLGLMSAYFNTVEPSDVECLQRIGGLDPLEMINCLAVVLSGAELVIKINSLQLAEDGLLCI